MNCGEGFDGDTFESVGMGCECKWEEIAYDTVERRGRQNGREYCESFSMTRASSGMIFRTNYRTTGAAYMCVHV